MTDDYITRTREFFGAKAATWDANFGHCHVRLRRGHRGAGIRHGGTAVDVGCCPVSINRPRFEALTWAEEFWVALA
jgi:hypothetical protein